VFLAHGCSHRASDFWPRHTSCPRCVGLPEEVYITKVALSMGLAPIAVSSHFSQCWSNRDEVLVADTLAKWMQDHKLINLPLFAIGASSGGTFVPHLADRVNKDKRLHDSGIRVQAIDVQIATFSKLPQGLHAVAITRMSRDQNTADFSKGMSPELTKDGLAVLNNVAEPLPLSETFFYDRVETISRTDSALLYAAIKGGGLLDDQGLLLEDPRSSQWREVVKARFPELLQFDSLNADESAISEELNVAWAMHEFTGDFVRQTLDFFLAHART